MTTPAQQRAALHLNELQAEPALVMASQGNHYTREGVELRLRVISMVHDCLAMGGSAVTDGELRRELQEALQFLPAELAVCRPYLERALGELPRGE